MSHLTEFCNTLLTKNNNKRLTEEDRTSRLGICKKLRDRLSKVGIGKDGKILL